MELISFKPEILERIIPDISLERHLKVGVRSNQRKFDEFKPVENLSAKSSNTLTSTIFRNGNTLIVCNITYGINDTVPNESHYTSVYPTVSISRGRVGAPTDEEMNLSQSLYEYILTSKVLPASSVVFHPKVTQEDGQPIDLEKNFKFNLFVSFKIFDRSGPLFDICQYALLQTLKQVKLPVMYINEFSKVSVENLEASEEAYDLSLDLTATHVSSNFGIYALNGENLIICDLENESEEFNLVSKGHVISTSDELKEINFINGDLLDVSVDDLKKLITISQNRAKVYKQ